MRDVRVGGGAGDRAVDAGWGEPGLTDAERVFAGAGAEKRLHLERFSAVRSAGGKGGTIRFDGRDITRLTPAAMAALTTFSAPMTLVLMHSKGLYSAIGTCFSAAAWITWSTPRMAVCSRSASRTSPMK